MPYKDREARNARVRARHKANPEKRRAQARGDDQAAYARLIPAELEAYKARKRAEGKARYWADPEKSREVKRASWQKRSADDPEGMLLAARKVNAKRRARLKGASVENVDPSVVLKRDAGVCGICHEPLIGEWHLDHVVPLARGGEHSYKNTQAAHPLCNMSKGARLPEEVAQ